MSTSDITYRSIRSFFSLPGSLATPCELATGWPEFRSLYYQTASATLRPQIIDGWRLLRSTRGLDAMPYRRVGTGNPRSEVRARLRRFVSSFRVEMSGCELNSVIFSHAKN